MKPVITNKPSAPRKIRKLLTSRMDERWNRAKRKLERIESEILGRSPLGAKVIRPDTNYQDSFQIQQTAAEWIASKKNRCSESDLRNAMKAVRWLDEFANGRALTKRLVSEFCDSLHKKPGYSQNTCFLTGIKVREFLRWLVASGRCQQDFSLGLQWPSMKPQQARCPYTKTEYERLLKANDGYAIYWLIMLMWNTGMATVDACDLRWGSVDLDKCIITRNRSKTGTRQEIPIIRGSELHEELIKKRKECEGVYGSIKSDTPVSIEWFNNTNGTRAMLMKACERAGVKYKSPHSFRAAFVGRMHKLNPMVAMKITGHKSPSVFAAYADPDEATLRKEIAKLED